MRRGNNNADGPVTRRIALYILIALVVIGPSALVAGFVRKMNRELAFTPWTEAQPGGSITVLTAPRTMGYDASVSPDGTKLAFICAEPPFVPFMPFGSAHGVLVEPGSRPEDTPPYGFLMVSPSSGKRPRYLPLPRGHSPIGLPYWSPDGRQLYVGVWKEAEDRVVNQIWRVSADGGPLTQVSDGPYDASPALSPNGQWIAFTGTEDDRPYLMLADGNRRHLMLDEPITGYTLAWSPDSTKIAFVTKSRFERGAAPSGTPRSRSGAQARSAEGLRRAVVVYDLNAEKAFRLVTPYVGRQISWSLDGTEVLFTLRDYHDPRSGFGGSRVGAIRPEPGAKPRWLTPQIPAILTDPVAITPDCVAFFFPDTIGVVSYRGGIPQAATKPMVMRVESLSVAPDAPAMFYTRPAMLRASSPGGAICRMDFAPEFLRKVAAGMSDRSTIDAYSSWNGAMGPFGRRPGSAPRSSSPSATTAKKPK